MNSIDSLTTKKEIICLLPNPVNNTFQTRDFEGVATLVISDLNCIKLLKMQMSTDDVIPIDFLKKEIYIAKIITSTEVIERKLIKE